MPSYLSSFTPTTTVRSSSVAGAEMMTFFAPAEMCLPASAALVKNPVDSMTTSTPRSLHGSEPGSRFDRTLMSLPSTVMTPSPAETSYGSLPMTESYFSRWARVLVSVRSLTATISMS